MPEETEVEPPLTKEDWFLLNPPETLGEKLRALRENPHELRKNTHRAKILRKILQDVDIFYKQQQDRLQQTYPQAFFKPSYEQALILNAWMHGITFPIIFDANRLGKTVVLILNFQLYIFPNDPTWVMFKPYFDHLTRRVEVIQRPSFENIILIQQTLLKNPHLRGDPLKQPYESPNDTALQELQELIPLAFLPAYPSPPKTKGGTVWLGAPDTSFHDEIVLKRWKQWLPQPNISHWSDYEQEFQLSTASQTNTHPTIWDFYCKSYDSKDTVWSGNAVDAIILTEGINQDILNEVKQRPTHDAVMSWDYTPYEARNAGRKTAIAHKVYKGEEQLPLQSFVFSGFGIKNAPDHVVPPQKKADLIRMWEGKPQGEARLYGKFYTSSPLILSQLDRPTHILTHTWKQIRQKFPNGQIYRSLDPGYDHPTAATWAYLLPSNIWIIYRAYSRRNTTISERVEDIIRLSNNKREKVQYGKGIDDYYFQEIHPSPASEPAILTAADYHLFKADERTGQNYALNYTKEGLSLTESTHMKPRDRGQLMDKLLTPSPLLTHPLTNRTPAPRIFFLINEPGIPELLERLENLFWATYSTGERKGEPKDEMQEHEDDEFDSLSYAVCGPYRWSNLRAIQRSHRDIEPDNRLESLATLARARSFKSQSNRGAWAGMGG
jgi:hypothetical protein